MTEWESYESWMKELKPATYVLELSPTQACIVKAALEDYMRLRMNQFWDFANDYAQGGYIYNKEDPENDKKFSEYMERRDTCREYLDKMENVVFGKYPLMRKRAANPRAMEAGDIYRTLRHQFAWHQYPRGGLGVDFDEPFKMGPEPLPKCYIKEDTANAGRKERERQNIDNTKR